MQDPTKASTEASRPEASGTAAGPDAARTEAPSAAAPPLETEEEEERRLRALLDFDPELVIASVRAAHGLTEEQAVIWLKNRGWLREDGAPSPAAPSSEPRA